MPKLVSKVPALISERRMSNDEFIGRCRIAGLSEKTARKLMEGKTNFNDETAATIAGILGVGSISDLKEFV